MTQTASPISGQLVSVARDIKLSHSVFALPWALFATFLAAGGAPTWGQVGLIVLCMVSARTVAMSANRLLDAPLDALNPRTAGRAIPAGRVSRAIYLGVLLVCAGVFVLCTSGFGVWYDNWWPTWLSLPVLGFISAYPLLKRFSALCHYYLGAALALAPVCAWVAIAGTLDVAPLLIAGAVLLWTAGFDVIYACQDYTSDVQTGVFSVPAKVGISKALWIARVTHVGSVGFMVTLGAVSPSLDWIYYTGVACATVLLVIEHAVVRADDLSKVGLAFFTLNGIISLVVGGLGIVDVMRG